MVSKEEVQKTAKACLMAGTMCALRCRSVRALELPNVGGEGCTIYRIYVDGGLMFTATSLHAFTVVRAGERHWVPANKLLRDDLIWVDVSALCADNMFARTR